MDGADVFRIGSMEGFRPLKPEIKETIVVEGRDDQSAVLAAVSANVICTHGYGINGETLDQLDAAYRRTGLIIFTDPDHAGRQIRERLLKLFPEAKHAYLTQAQAERDGDIGIENAAPQYITNALYAAGADFSGYFGTAGKKTGQGSAPVTMEDLICAGLTGGEGSARRRSEVGARLGIGSANAAAFLKRLRRMGISAAELFGALEKRE